MAMKERQRQLKSVRVGIVLLLFGCLLLSTGIAYIGLSPVRLDATTQQAANSEAPDSQSSPSPLLRSSVSSDHSIPRTRSVPQVVDATDTLVVEDSLLRRIMARREAAAEPESVLVDDQQQEVAVRDISTEFVTATDPRHDSAAPSNGWLYRGFENQSSQPWYRRTN